MQGQDSPAAPGAQAWLDAGNAAAVLEQQAWTAASQRDIVLSVIDSFGPARCMFASNFPVDSLCASFASIFSGFQEIVRDLSVAEQRGLCRNNAIRLYAME